MLHLFFLCWCCFFLFGCAHSNVVVSLYFGGFYCLFFGYVCKSVATSLYFKDFYCLFLVVCVVILLFHDVSKIFAIVAYL